MPGYSADTAVPIDAIIDLTSADLHNPNNTDDAQVGLIVESGEVEEELIVTSVDADADEHDVAEMLLSLAEGTI